MRSARSTASFIANRHADRQRHHAARHALHHRASVEPHRDDAGALHLPATGSNARIYGLDSGLLAPGKAPTSC